MQLKGIAEGVLSDRQIGEMIDNGHISSEPAIEVGQIQPASLDLRLGEKAYRLRASFLPGKNPFNLLEYIKLKFFLCD